MGQALWGGARQFGLGGGGLGARVKEGCGRFWEAFGEPWEALWGLVGLGRPWKTLEGSGESRDGPGGLGWP